jgi:hypothetical protein
MRLTKNISRQLRSIFHIVFIDISFSSIDTNAGSHYNPVRGCIGVRWPPGFAFVLLSQRRCQPPEGRPVKTLHGSIGTNLAEGTHRQMSRTLSFLMILVLAAGFLVPAGVSADFTVTDGPQDAEARYSHRLIVELASEPLVRAQAYGTQAAAVARSILHRPKRKRTYKNFRLSNSSLSPRCSRRCPRRRWPRSSTSAAGRSRRRTRCCSTAWRLKQRETRT